MRIKKNINYGIPFQILQTNIRRIVRQTVKRNTNEILGVKGLRGRFQFKQGFKLTELYSEVRPGRLNSNSAQNNREI